MEKVSFYSAGHRLTGYFRIPKTHKGKVPGIICCHGFSGDIEQYMQDIAERLTDAGYATLLYQHRGFGESEGPESRLIPREQAEDIRNAVTYLQTRMEVDPGQIALYGTSFGGANVVYAAAYDKRVKCVVSTNGVGDCERWLKSLWRRWEWVEFLKRIEEDRKNRVLTGRSRYVDSSEILPADPYTLKITQPPKSKGRKYPMETADAMLDYKPELVVDMISPRPILFIHMGSDVTVPPEESFNMYQRAGEPKKIVIVEGYGHFDVYKFRNPEVFDQVMDTALGWYREYLSSVNRLG